LRHRSRFWRWFTIGFFAALAVGTVPASAQEDIKVRVWELAIGTPVTELPPEYMDPHCGTNGGPPSLRLNAWADFSHCPVEAATGLREIWFTEDDEREYIALANRMERTYTGPFMANFLLNHKVIYSLLVDDGGLFQGYRVFTDQSEPDDIRLSANRFGDSFRHLYDYNAFQCTDEPRVEGESAVSGEFVKNLCVADIDDVHITIERRLLRKRGQAPVDPNTRRATTGYFESTSRVEVIAAELLNRTQAQQ
jgi:hypothetical protein